MNGSPMNKNYIIPKFFRTLIIDDKIASDLELREFFSNIFTAIVLEQAGKHLPVEVIFEPDPAKGFTRWQDETFDFTLIDVDFSSKRKAAKQEDNFSRYVLNSQDQGLNIFKLLEAKLHGPFAYREKMCQFFLWTALERGVLKKMLVPFDIKDNERILKKDSQSFQIISKHMSNLIKKIKEDTFSPAQKIERLLFALRRDFDNLSLDLAGGCLIADTMDAFPFLPTLGKYNGNNENYHIRLCCAHIPSLLLDNPNKFRFLTLHRIWTEFMASDAIAYLLKGEQRSEISVYCKELSRRHKSRKQLPWYPNSGNKWDESKSPAYIAAATPLTGISVIGGSNAVSSLSDKIEALLDNAFDMVVLKTTYLDGMGQWQHVWWPSVQIQSHMRTRCLYPDTDTPTLWNSGKTAMETLPPKQMNELLNLLCRKGNNISSRVIVSLGSKYPMGKGLARKFQDSIQTSLRAIWKRIFEDVFKDLPHDCFPVVEINVRHFLREIVRHHLGGDEYLTPRVLNEKASSDPVAYWREFKFWLATIHDVALEHKKKLILKLPHRSDTLAYVECIASLREHHLISAGKEKATYGVRGITVVNALKTPVPNLTAENDTPPPHSPAWYADPNSWHDGEGKLYQMSGRLVGAYRNQILSGLMAGDGLKILKDIGLEVWISGGLTSKNEVQHCLYLESNRKLEDKVITGIQLGTWPLLDMNLRKDTEKNWRDRAAHSGPGPSGKYALDVSACQKICLNCNIHESCQYGALGKKEKGKQVIVLEPEKCLECLTWDCIRKCPNLKKLSISKQTDQTDKKDKVSKTKALRPRFSFLNIQKCEACGRCNRTFYCDTFLDRVNTYLPPLMDPRYCSGCGLCAQVCRSGALKLYPPNKFLVLLSPSQERKEILDILHIPHFQYYPDTDIKNFSDWPEKKLPKESNQKFDWNFFWENRIKQDRFMLHQSAPQLYPEDRLRRKNKCISTATTLWDNSQDDATPDYGKETIKRAVLWSQLIWSDPGQVLWDSFLLSIKSRFIRHDTENTINSIDDFNGNKFFVSFMGRSASSGRHFTE